MQSLSFREYLKKGYYPFSVENGFELRMEQVISQLAPYKPSVENLAVEIGVSKNNVPDYLVYLEKAGMIGQLRDDTGGLRGLGKVEKVYIDNPNLMSVLAGGKPEIGNLRETFFYNQMRMENEIISSKESDFAIGQYTFEIGGRKKAKEQVENVPHGIIVKDDIEFGHGITVPFMAIWVELLTRYCIFWRYST